ncbi:MAG: 3-phosphoshikimate 1-carboxyvinyltransferase [Dehalococcoidia bacterium]|nr:3-phosphoshikimate 1-carboxyvinyltransferase [Dehalococcoidia bacterium]
MRTTVIPPRRLEFEVTPPGDKSIAHRSLILNAAAVGPATVTNFPRGGDTLATLACIRALGLRVTDRREPDEFTATLTFEPHGIGGLNEPERVLDVRNSGTTMRFLLGLLAGAPMTAVLTGDRSLRGRPMGRVAEPLAQMGAEIFGRAGGTLAPLTVRGGNLHGFEYTMPVASAQVKSALLLAGLSARGPTILEEPSPSRDHTERMLRAMGVSVNGEGGRVRLDPGAPPKAIDVRVPADISGAAPWLVAGAIHPNARITVRRVGVNPTRTGIIDILLEMGARLDVGETEEGPDEPIADITVESSDLKAVEIGGSIIPRLIDELPLLALAATQAAGTTVIRDAQELRVKESDRIAATVGQLSRLGARLEERPDGMLVFGRQQLQGATVRSGGDHRLALTLGVAGVLARGTTHIDGAEAVDVSYPGFWKALEQAGGAIRPT